MKDTGANIQLRAVRGREGLFLVDPSGQRDGSKSLGLFGKDLEERQPLGWYVCWSEFLPVFSPS